MDRKAVAVLLVEFDEKQFEMEDLAARIAHAADIDQDVMAMKVGEFKDWLYRVFEDRFGRDE